MRSARLKRTPFAPSASLFDLDTFLRKNQNQSPEDALEELGKIQKKADDASLDVVVYISMAFGNPYGDLWSADEVTEAIRCSKPKTYA